MLNEVQKIDYDRFISTIFIDKEYRGQVAVLLKFNIELSRIKNKVSEPTLGMIRLQWWRNFFELLFSNPEKAPKHELKNSLQKIIEQNKELKFEDFDRLISVREKDFDNAPFSNQKELELYLQDSAGMLNILIAKIVGGKLSDLNIELINKISIAWGISAVLRSVGNNYNKNREVMPQDLLQKHNLKKDDFGSMDFIKSAKPVIRELVARSEGLLSESESDVESIMKKDKALKFVRSYFYLAKRHNRKVSANDYNIFSRGYQVELGFWGLMSLYFKT